eukprot:3833435-Karenia_brevis.AAC.1
MIAGFGLGPVQVLPQSLRGHMVCAKIFQALAVEPVEFEYFLGCNSCMWQWCLRLGVDIHAIDGDSHL